MRYVTIWTRMKGLTWKHNHVTDGFDDNPRPTPKAQYYGGPPFPDQARNWSAGVWKREYGIVEDDGTLRRL